MDQKYFKFHYVSINSNLKANMYRSSIPVFKFHYVSINSENNNNLFRYHAALNSIMFLLILEVNYDHSKGDWL